MRSNSDDYYQRIGTEAIRATGYTDGKLLLDAQVEDGVISVDLFHQRHPGEPVRFHLASEPLLSLVYSCWETGDFKVEPRSWAAMHYVVDSGSFLVDLIYPDQLNADEDPLERRSRTCRTFFPGVPIDYSQS